MRDAERQKNIGPLSLPGSTRLRYSVTGQNGVQPLAGVNAELLWLHDGKDYEARLTVGSAFLNLRSQSTVGSIGADGLEPRRFGDKTRSAPEVAAHFERDKGKIIFSANKADAPLLSGAQDRLSVLLQLSAMLAGDATRYPPASTITLQTASAQDADTWLFTVEGEETLALPYGALKALKLTRNPRREFDQKIELWFAPALNWLPVRIKLTEGNGNFVDQQLRASDKP